MTSRRMRSLLTEGNGSPQVGVVEREKSVPRHSVSTEIQSPWRTVVRRYHRLRELVYRSKVSIIDREEVLRFSLHDVTPCDVTKLSLDPRSVLFTGKSLHHVMALALRSSLHDVTPLDVTTEGVGISHVRACCTTSRCERQGPVFSWRHAVWHYHVDTPCDVTSDWRSR